MIEYSGGDIFADGAEAIVNPVNCVGVMGKGLAHQFKKRFPENFQAYAAACKRDELRPGEMLVFKCPPSSESADKSRKSPSFIINFPTKRHWRNASRMEDIEAGLKRLVEVIRRHQIRSIAIPALGSGLGGLDWAEVKPRIEAALKHLEEKVRIIIHEPHGNSPKHQ